MAGPGQSPGLAFLGSVITNVGWRGGAWLQRQLHADRHVVARLGPVPGVLQDRLVKHQVGDDLSELAVLLSERPQLPQLPDVQAGILLPPPVKRGLSDALLPTDLTDDRTAFGLAQRLQDLLGGEATLLHRTSCPAHRAIDHDAPALNESQAGPVFG